MPLRRRASLAALACALGALAPAPAALSAADPAAKAALAFRRDDGTEVVLDKDRLAAQCGLREVEVVDPYYGTPRRFLACPLERVFELGFGAPPAAFEDRDFLLEALDGYTRTAPGSQLASGGAWLAFADAARAARGEAGFDPIDRRQVDPGPFYLVWTGPGRNDAHRWPWPYQLARIAVARFEERFPHTVPVGAADGSPAHRGFELFRRECAMCHAINGEGGTVGPELNVPRSIVEYRPADQIKAYVRDPQSFRYTSMPSHRHLTDADLDALVAYFTHMSAHKRDPGPRPAAPETE
ncbi:MAG TPA: cytochrome c [Myxococcota bacterium]|nr:cytochrome c [Myxococcota bacterium]